MAKLDTITKVEFNQRYNSNVETVDTINSTDSGVSGIYENHIGVIIEYSNGNNPIKILNAVRITFEIK